MLKILIRSLQKADFSKNDFQGYLESGVGKRNETERKETKKTENFQKRNETERKKLQNQETKRKATGNET
jgi:hypothetical protein